MEKQSKVGEWDIKVYCQKHQIQGKRKVHKIKQILEGHQFNTNIILSEEEEILLHKVETRLSKTKKDFDT